MERLLGNFPEKWRRDIYQSLSLIIMMFLFLFQKKETCPIKKRILFVDFRYAGNLRAFFTYAKENKLDLEFGFLPADPADYQFLENSLPEGIRLLSRASIKDVAWAYQSNIILTSIMMRRFLSITKLVAPHIKFVQAFHSLNLLGEPESWFSNISQFDKVFCASEWIVSQFERITNKKDTFLPTGFAVADEIYTFQKTREETLLHLGLDPHQKVVLLSPTLTKTVDYQCSPDLFPYSEFFLEKVDLWAKNSDVQVIFRNHPHEEFDSNLFAGLDKIKLFNSKKYKDVAEQLHAADIMVTDLSGIGGYFMALKRPMIFLEAIPNHSKEELTFFIRPDELPGPRVKTLDNLISNLDQIVKTESKASFQYKDRIEEAYVRLYGNYFDGKACKRYFNSLSSLLK